MSTDNLMDLYGSFELRVDKRYAGGSAYICRSCGQEAHSIEGFFPCQNDFVPMSVWCNECRAKWRLTIEPICGDPQGRRDGNAAVCGMAGRSVS